MIETTRRDLRHGLRGLLRSPGFTAVAVLSLGLGIGATTTIFSLVNAVLLRPLQVERPEELVAVYTSDADGYPYATSSYPDYRDLRDGTDLLEGLAAHNLTVLNLQRSAGAAEMLFGEVVTGNYFELLGIEAGHGRVLTPSDDAPGAPPVVVLGHGLWQRRFGADPGVVGATVRLNGHAVTVVGVAPESFTGTFPVFAPDVWTPMGAEVLLRPGAPDPEVLEHRGSRSLFLAGRLRPGVTVERARATLQGVMAGLAEEYPATNTGRQVAVLPRSEVRLHPFVDGAIVPVAGLLMGLVGLVLLIACANVANMLLARAAARRQEIAVRISLGARRGQLVRQLLTESLLLGLAGSVVGVLAAWWTQGLLLAFQPPIPVSVAIDLRMDGRVLAFGVLAGVLTGLAFGLAPALQATRPGIVGLQDGAARGGRRRRRLGLRNVLVMGQVAVSLVLLVAAGLLVRSLQSARQVDLGFDAGSVAVVTPAIDLLGYGDDEARAFYRRVDERLRALPGVTAVARGDRSPLGLSFGVNDYAVEGHQPADGGDTVDIDTALVSPGYFETLGVPLQLGRDVAASDTAATPPVAVVSAAMARRFWPGESPVGRVLRRGGAEGPEIRVVGVVADYRYRTVGEDPRSVIHLPLSQRFESFQSVLVRTDGDAAALVEAVRREILAVEPDVVFMEAQPLSANAEVSLFPVRMGVLLLGLFGTLATGLAAVGLYGVVAYSVSHRSREIGLRMALGAGAREVLALVVRQGMGIVAVGLGVGIVAAAALSWLLSGFLYGVGSLDPLAFGGMALLLAGVALVANVVPARRAARVDPMITLRAD